LVWKSGVILSKDGARAEVLELYRYHKGEIRIRVSGKRQRNLLIAVMHELGKIHKSYDRDDDRDRLKYNTLVPCNCPTCNNSQAPYFYTLERLYKFLDTNKQQIQCYESGDDIEVRGLIDDLALSRRGVTTGDNLRASNLMSESKYNIKADVVQIIENNPGKVIAKEYAADPGFTEAVAEMVELLRTLQQQHPTATEAEAEDIIEAEFEDIKTQKPQQWKTLRRQLLSRERWFNGGKALLTETAKHYVEGNVFYKAGIAFMEGFSADEDEELI